MDEDAFAVISTPKWVDFLLWSKVDTFRVRFKLVVMSTCGRLVRFCLKPRRSVGRGRVLISVSTGIMSCTSWGMKTVGVTFLVDV